MKLFKRLVIPSAAIISASSLISRLLGVIRDRMLATQFGATRINLFEISELDSYYAAFRIPDFIYNLLIIGTISAVFIPMFTDLKKKDQQKSFELVSTTLNAILIILMIFCLIGFIFAPFIVRHAFQEFTEPALKLTIELTRIMILSPIIFGLSSIVGSVLNSYHKFVAYSLAPIFYNLGIIIGIIVLVPYLGVKGVALGVLIGSFLHLLIQLPSLYKIGYHYQPIINFKNKELIQISKLAIPRIISTAVAQINMLVDTLIAGTLIAGSITILNWAQNLQFLPVSLIGISMAIVHFPIFSEYVSSNSHEALNKKLSQSIRIILFLIIPATAGMLLLRTEIVRLVYGDGRFNWQDTILTAQTLGYFVISLFAQGLIPIITRVYYAKKNTKFPVIISLISITVNISLSLYFTKILNMGVTGLALSSTIANITNLVLLIITMQTKLSIKLNIKNISTTTYKVVLATIVMAGFVQLAKDYSGTLFGDLDTTIKVAFKIIFSVIVGIISYFFATFILKCQEFNEIIKNRFQRD